MSCVKIKADVHPTAGLLEKSNVAPLRNDEHRGQETVTGPFRLSMQSLAYCPPVPQRERIHLSTDKAEASLLIDCTMGSSEF